MVELIARTETDLPHLQATLFDSLSCLAYHSIETKGIILSMGGTNQILKILSVQAKSSPEANKKLTTATKLLKVKYTTILVSLRTKTSGFICRRPEQN